MDAVEEDYSMVVVVADVVDEDHSVGADVVEEGHSVGADAVEEGHFWMEVEVDQSRGVH